MGDAVRGPVIRWKGTFIGEGADLERYHTAA